VGIRSSVSRRVGRHGQLLHPDCFRGRLTDHGLGNLCTGDDVRGNGLERATIIPNNLILPNFHLNEIREIPLLIIIGENPNCYGNLLNLKAKSMKTPENF
jgi:hypothetical protein